MKYTVKTALLRAFLILILILLAISILYPLLWMVISGFKNNAELFRSSFGMPTLWRWQNYVEAWNVGIAQYFLNSVFVTVVTVALTVLVSAFAAYSISRYEYKGKNVLFILILCGLLLAPQVSLISLYEELKVMGIYNTYFALILPLCAFGITFAVFLMRSYFLSLPKSIEESAFIDGGNSWTIFWKIVVPMSKPIIISAALLTGMSSWNNFIFSLVFIQDNSLWTIPIGIMNLTGTLSTDWGTLIAALTLSAIPIIAVFVMFQKQFVRGLSEGSVKG